MLSERIIDGYSDVKSKSITHSYSPGTGSFKYPPAYSSLISFNVGLYVVGLLGDTIFLRFKYVYIAPSLSAVDM